MSKKILIVFGTRYGSTAEIAKELAKLMENQGITTQTVNLKEVKRKSWPLIDEYDGILVGSSIKIGRWMKEPKKFLENNKKIFNTRGKVLGLFVSAATAVSDYVKAKADYLEKEIQKLGIEVDIYDTFGLILDFSESSRLGMFSKKMLQSIATNLAKEKGIQIDLNGKNEILNRERLQSFVEKFLILLKNK
jgi:menaquinone-dependent protoporphyrinogen IX oxidase